ncbi:MAG: leucine-rich repeat domain-containing protein [Oscillospiraceae bacterium]|nr:leucine-rich repeat domain-containing protein [Oscillospiraceae bacterium]
MRKSIVMIMLLSLCLGLAACGGEPAGDAPVAEVPVPPAEAPVTSAPAPAETAAPQAPAADGISWHVADGTLTISGQGTMADYELLSAPWDESGDSLHVERLVVEEGVRYLGAHAFAACMNLAEISLPQSLRGIGSYCFADCLNLTEIQFSKSLIFIGDFAFSGTGLRRVALPEGVARLGERCFTLCTQLTEVSLPDSLCAMGEDVFADCDALERISVHTGANAQLLVQAQGLDPLLDTSGTAIPAADYPWSGTASGEYGSCSWALQHGVLTLTGSVVPSFGTTDGTQAPWAPMAELITEVRVADGISSIGDYAFWNCSELRQIKVPDSVSYIGAYAFGACGSLESFAFPAALDTIGVGAFSFCTSLVEVKLPDGLVHIDDDAFQMCTALKRMSIPASVTEIGGGALSFGGEEAAEITAPAGSWAEQWVKDNL